MYDGVPEPAFEITVRQEAVRGLVSEVPPLLESFYADIARDQPLPALEVAYDVYIRMADANLVRGFTARRDGLLVGLLLFFVMPNLHHYQTTWATCDAFWLMPDARRPMVALRMLKLAEASLRDEGVHVMTVAEKVLRPALGHLLDHLGFRPTEVKYQKVLGP